MNRALMRTFAERLHRLREDRGLSQRQLGLLSGVEPIQISRYERAAALPAADSLAEMARVLQVPMETLLLGKDTAQPEPQLRNALLLDRLSELDELDRQDQDTVISVIDAIILRRNVQGIVGPQDKTA